ncbi:DUF4430 domain-containing protein [Ectobacillus polymachus]|uniref:DUF4430 domain-containing protein n=1 Tax=Ectobacillus polymachus TaxID=1508806 RepID=UPI003A8AE5A7
MKYVKMLFVCCTMLTLLVSCSTQPAKNQSAVANTQQAQAGQKQDDQKQQQAQQGQQEEQKKDAANQQDGSSSSQQSSNQQSNASSNASAPAADAKPAQTQSGQSQAQSQSQSQQVASAPAASKSEPAPQKNVATLSIRSDNGMFLNTTEVELTGNDTVYSVLSRTVKSKHIQMESEGAGPSAYVMGINNLYEKDRGPKSGWMYRVNGAYLNVSAGAASVKNGDKIEWVYTTNGEQP